MLSLKVQVWNGSAYVDHTDCGVVEASMAGELAMALYLAGYTKTRVVTILGVVLIKFEPSA